MNTENLNIIQPENLGNRQLRYELELRHYKAATGDTRRTRTEFLRQQIRLETNDRNMREQLSSPYEFETDFDEFKALLEQMKTDLKTAITRDDLIAEASNLVHLYWRAWRLPANLSGEIAIRANVVYQTEKLWDKFLSIIENSAENERYAPNELSEYFRAASNSRFISQANSVNNDNNHSAHSENHSDANPNHNNHDRPTENRVPNGQQLDDVEPNSQSRDNVSNQTVNLQPHSTQINGGLVLPNYNTPGISQGANPSVPNENEQNNALNSTAVSNDTRVEELFRNYQEGNDQMRLIHDMMKNFKEMSSAVGGLSSELSQMRRDHKEKQDELMKEVVELRDEVRDTSSRMNAIETNRSLNDTDSELFPVATRQQNQPPTTSDQGRSNGVERESIGNLVNPSIPVSQNQRNIVMRRANVMHSDGSSTQRASLRVSQQNFSNSLPFVDIFGLQNPSLSNFNYPITVNRDHLPPNIVISNPTAMPVANTPAITNQNERQPRQLFVGNSNNNSATTSQNDNSSSSQSIGNGQPNPVQTSSVNPANNLPSNLNIATHSQPEVNRNQMDNANPSNSWNGRRDPPAIRVNNNNNRNDFGEHAVNSHSYHNVNQDNSQNGQASHPNLIRYQPRNYNNQNRDDNNQFYQNNRYRNPPNTYNRPFRAPTPLVNNHVNNNAGLNNEFNDNNVIQDPVATYNPNRTSRSNKSGGNPMHKWNFKFSGTLTAAEASRTTLALKAEDFLRKVKRMMRSEQVDDEEAFDKIEYLLSDDAERWYKAYAKKFSNWSEFQKEFKEEYCPEDFEFQLMKKINSTVQHENESLNSYINNMLSLINTLNVEWPEKQIIHTLLGNMRSEFSAPIRLHNPTTLNQFSELTRRLDVTTVCDRPSKPYYNKPQTFRFTKGQENRMTFTPRNDLNEVHVELPPNLLVEDGECDTDDEMQVFIEESENVPIKSIHNYRQFFPANVRSKNADRSNAPERIYHCFDCGKEGHTALICDSPTGQAFCRSCGKKNVTTRTCDCPRARAYMERFSKNGYGRPSTSNFSEMGVSKTTTSSTQ